MVLLFVVPAIVDGEEPLVVAVVGSMAVMLATIALAHGTGPKSLAAMLGTAVSLLLTVGLAVLFTRPRPPDRPGNRGGGLPPVDRRATCRSRACSWPEW